MYGAPCKVSSRVCRCTEDVGCRVQMFRVQRMQGAGCKVWRVQGVWIFADLV